MRLEFAAIASAYGFPNVVDYERGSGLLISSGAGTMMAVMDMCPSLRYCLDIDANRSGRLGGLLTWAWLYKWTPIVIAGWFSITSPDGLRAALEETLWETGEMFDATIYAAPDVTLCKRLPHARSLQELSTRVASIASAARA